MEGRALIALHHRCDEGGGRGGGTGRKEGRNPRCIPFSNCARRYTHRPLLITTHRGEFGNLRIARPDATRSPLPLARVRKKIFVTSGFSK